MAVKFHGLPTGGLRPGHPLVVKIIAGVGYPCRVCVVVVSGGWLPLVVAGFLCLLFLGNGFQKAVPGMILPRANHFELFLPLQLPW